ncbi:MAG: hypothetical protein ABI151_08735 [Chitinophagaceae bacterium]
MPTQNQETQTNSGDQPEDKVETSQALTGTPVREGQENSSINDDKKDENKEIEGPMDKDDSAVNHEEYIQERNTKEKSPDE